MTHIDPEDLALVALNNADASAIDLEHLSECSECEVELVELRRTVRLARMVPTVELEAPGGAVWERIHRELGLAKAVATPPRKGAFPSVEHSAAALTATETPANPVIALPRRRRLWLPLVAAVTVGLVAGFGGNAWWQGQAAAERVIARAQLDPLPGWNDTGSAAVAESTDGDRFVTIEVDSQLATETSTEVWLLTEDATGLVSLGFLTGTTGRFVVPADIDLAQYPLVDVSSEPNDGDPTHSGDSIVRGELRES